MFRMIYATFRRMRRRPLGLLLGMRQPHITTCMKKRCLNTIAVEEGQLPGCRLRSRMAHSWMTIAVEDGPLPWIPITDEDGPFPWISITGEDGPIPLDLDYWRGWPIPLDLDYGRGWPIPLDLDYGRRWPIPPM